MISLLCRFINQSGEQAATRSDVFIRTMMGISVIAAATHAAFLLLFVLAGVTVLAWANVLSILTYALAAALARTHPLKTALLIVGEIIAHGLLAVYLVGWESGFQFYIILIIPVAIVSDLSAKYFRVLTSFGVGLLYLATDFTMRSASPQYALPDATLQGLHFFNLIGVMSILALLAGMYSQLVSQAESVLRHQACTDPLTQLRNRRFVLEVAKHEAAVFTREGRPLALIMCDIDHFKSVNDRHGHQSGDDVLKVTATVLQHGLRTIDHVARWGGEEFLILLPGTELVEAQAVAERLRASVAAQVCTSRKGPIPITMTFGVTQLKSDETVEQALSRADHALYQGKEAGRNRVEVA